MTHDFSHEAKHVIEDAWTADLSGNPLCYLTQRIEPPHPGSPGQVKIKRKRSTSHFFQRYSARFGTGVRNEVLFPL